MPKLKLSRPPVAVPEELRQYIGRIGKAPFGLLLIAVKILDARRAYGRTDLLVTPVTGEGEQWIALANVTIQ